MYEITYTVHGRENTRTIWADSREEAVAQLLEWAPEACVVRIVGPWAFSN